MAVSGVIAPAEELGRSVFHTQDAKRARRGRIPKSVFLIPKGKTEVSVDRLTVAPKHEAVPIAETRAAARSRKFQGWVVVTAENAAANGRRVEATPQLDNPYHADIILPDAVTEDRKKQIRHAQELADASIWRERP